MRFQKKLNQDLRRHKVGVNDREKYCDLYLYTEGGKHYTSYERLSELWGVDISSVSKIVKRLKDALAIDTTRVADQGGIATIFITPLIHPDTSMLEKVS